MIRVLGPIQVITDDGDAIDLPSVTQRRLLGVLAVHAPNRVRAEQLAEMLGVSAGGLRTSVSRLRKALGGQALASVSGGYQLTAAVDAQLFCRAVAAVPAGTGRTSAAASLATLEEALGLWAGPALEEFAEEEWASGEAARLSELYAGAAEDYAEALVAAGRCSDAIAVLSGHIARYPFRDRARGLMLRALAGSGRQAEALGAYRDFRTMLVDELGTEPSPEVQDIARRVADGWDGTAPQSPPRAAHASAAASSVGPAGRRSGSRPGLNCAGEFPTSLLAARNGPFAGRSDVVADLYSGWQSSRWHTLLVAGEPGIGKTRLLAELAHHMHSTGAAVSIGRCDEDFVVSYRPWTELLEPLLRSLSAEAQTGLGPDHLRELCLIVPSMAHRLNVTAVPFAGDADTRRVFLLDAIVALLQAVGPVVLVFDDLQWIDQPSLRMLRRIVTDALPGVTILGAYRDTDVGPLDPLTAVLADLRRVERVQRLTVGGIDDTAVAELVRSSAGQASGADSISRARAIHARTAGNPLFVTELIAHLADHDAGADAGAPGLSEPDLPDSLVELIDRRVSRLGGEALGILRIAATAGQRFDADVVEGVVELERASHGGAPGPATDVLAQLERARDAGVIVDDGDAMVFRHAILRSALLAHLSAARRRRLHRDIAAIIEKVRASSPSRHLQQLAYHHDKAGSTDAPRWYERTATAAVGSFDATAVGLADRGLDLLATADRPDPALRCDLLITRAVGLRLAGTENIAGARRAAEAAIALADPERIASALLSLGVRSVNRDFSEHISFLAGGLAHLTDLSQVSRWNVAAELCLRKVMIPSANAAEHRHEMLDVITHLDPGDPPACQIAMRCARCLTSLSLPRDAVPVVERFQAGCHGVDSEGLPVELGLSTMWLHLGDRAASDRYLAIASADPLRRYWVFDAQVRQRQVMRHLLDGRWSDASAEITEMRVRAARDPNILLGCDAQESWLRRETGAADKNYRIMCATAAMLPGLLLPQAVLACDAAEAGYPQIALAQLDRLAAGDYRDAGGHWMTVMAAGNLAWAAIAIDARHHASQLRRLLAPFQGQMAVIGTGTHVLCAVDRLLGGLADLEGDHDNADRLFAAALSLERAMHSPPLQARTQHWWARALYRRGDHSRARRLLVQSRATADMLGMTGLAAQLDTLQAQG
jgi:DNA-binding SARP family transcriptional activator